MALSDGFGLLKDFLEHVVWVAGDLGLTRIDDHVLHIVSDVAFVAVANVEAIGGDDGELVLLQIDDLVGAAGERRRVAGEVVFAVADANDERAAEASADDHVRIVAEHDAEAVGAAELREGRLHGGNKRCIGVERIAAVAVAVSFVIAGFELFGDQVGDDFGVGRRLKDVAIFE